MQKTNSTQSALPFWRQLGSRLILAFILLGILPVLIVAVAILNRTGSQATDQVYNQLDSVTELKSDQILRWLDEGELAMDTLLSGPNAERFANFAGSTTYTVQERAEISEILSGAVESQYFKRMFVYNESGMIVASSDPADIRKSAKGQPYFEISLHTDYIQSPIPDSSSQQLVMYITRPLRSGKIQASGVLVGELNIDTLAGIMTERTGLGESGETYLVSLQNNNLLTPSRFEGYEMNAAYHSEGIDQGLKGIKGRGGYTSYRPVTVFGSYRFIPELQAALLAEVEQSQALAAYKQAQWVGILIALISVFAAILVGLFYSRSISRPIRALTVSAQRIGSGELKTEVVELRRQDEIGVLARAFHQMQSELVASYEKLEQRVADRTKALSSVAEVSTVASTILETKRLLQEVVDLSKERFVFYHSHIYLLNDAGDTLVLASGAGEPGRQMVAEGRLIPLDREQSLVARAAREKKGVTVNDVTQARDFLPNPLLPDTRSELAVPMMIGDQVIGVFDVQSEVAGRFTEADIAVQTTLASQVASAVQNARLYTQAETTRQEAQKTAAQLSEALGIAKLANWEYDVARDRFIFNDQFYSIFHTTAEREGGYELSSAEYAQRLVHPDDLPVVGAAIEKALASTDLHYSTQLEHRVLYADGGTGYISVEVHIERDNQGHILRYYGANQDITERKRLEQITAQRARLQEAINFITQKIQSATTIEDAMQIAARELGRALGMRQTLVALEPSALSSSKTDNDRLSQN
jgi:GAF domain-containing protein